MPMTPNGAASSYGTPADLLDHYDIRTVADLISDVGTRVGGSPNPTPSVVTSNARLQKIMNYAAGLIEAACLRGARYLPADLQALTGVGKELLVGLNCDLTMCYLYRRRPDKGQTPPFCLAAMEMLQALGNGELLFPFVEAEQAGLPKVTVDQAYDYERRALVAQQARRYFGTRSEELNPSDPTTGYVQRSDPGTFN